MSSADSLRVTTLLIKMLNMEILTPEFFFLWKKSNQSLLLQRLLPHVKYPDLHIEPELRSERARYVGMSQVLFSSTFKNYRVFGREVTLQLDTKNKRVTPTIQVLFRENLDLYKELLKR